jgi:MFS family permease
MAQQAAQYIRQFRGFSRPIELYMVSNFIAMLSFQVALLYLNFYLEALGEDAAFIGLYNALPSLITVLLGLPVGLLSDRIGPRRAILLGTLVQTVGLIGTALSATPAPLILCAALQGVGNTLNWTSGGPFMMQHTRPDQRSAVFSLQAALANGTGFLGNLLGGYVPLLLALALGVGADSLPAMRVTLWLAALVNALAFIPLSLARGPRRAAAEPTSEPVASPRRFLFSNPGLVARLVLPGTLVGLGAGMNIPVLNLFLNRRFGVDFSGLGLVFAFSAIGTMVAILLQPLLAARVGRVRSTVLVQVLSLPFLIIMGFVPIFPLVVLALITRGALMNMGNPIFSAFSMEQIPASERARFSSLTAMLWSLGWATGSTFSGWWRSVVGFDAGFNTTFALMAICYAASFVLLWWWFDRPEAAARRTRGAELRPVPGE